MNLEFKQVRTLLYWWLKDNYTQSCEVELSYDKESGLMATSLGGEVEQSYLGGKELIGTEDMRTMEGIDRRLVKLASSILSTVAHGGYTPLTTKLDVKEDGATDITFSYDGLTIGSATGWYPEVDNRVSSVSVLRRGHGLVELNKPFIYHLDKIAPNLEGMYKLTQEEKDLLATKPFKADKGQLELAPPRNDDFKIFISEKGIYNYVLEMLDNLESFKSKDISLEQYVGRVAFEAVVLTREQAPDYVAKDVEFKGLRLAVHHHFKYGRYYSHRITSAALADYLTSDEGFGNNMQAVLLLLTYVKEEMELREVVNTL